MLVQPKVLAEEEEEEARLSPGCFQLGRRTADSDKGYHQSVELTLYGTFQVVRKLLSGKAPGADEIHWERLWTYLGSLG